MCSEGEVAIGLELKGSIQQALLKISGYAQTDGLGTRRPGVLVGSTLWR